MITVARTARRISAFCGAAAFALAALLSAPARAAAQYTLTFDQSAAATPSIAGNTMAKNDQVGASATDVTVTNGVIANFGTAAAPTGYANSTTSCTSATVSGGLCFENGTTYDESSSQGRVAVAGSYSSGGTAAVGEFDFATIGSDVASFISVTVSCDYSLNDTGSNCGQSTLNELELQIWNAAGTTELAYDWDPAFTNSATSTLNLTAADFTTVGGASLANLSTGFRFEWANVSGASGNCGITCTFNANGSDVFAIDNLKFDSQITPEPASLALFGTGLLGLAPLMLRRRRRTV